MPPVPISQTCKLTYQANNAPTGACALTVTVPAGFANFTSLSVRLWANATGQCWVVGAETRGTPPTEALPLIRFTAPAPSTEKIEYVSGDLPPKPGGCSTTANSNIKGGPLGTEKTIARPPTGTYTFFNEGLRGQNVEVTLVIVAK